MFRSSTIIRELFNMQLCGSMLHVNFNVFFKLIKEHLLVSELFIYQNARRHDKKNCEQ